MHMDNSLEFVAALGLVSGLQIYLFAANYSGQLIVDHGNELFNAIYKSLWYVAPVTMQRLLLFMMRCNIKGCKLCANNLFIASLEGFTTVRFTVAHVCETSIDILSIPQDRLL
ncbi:uncharacterized protein LOC112589781 isoform X1 [Harpegnathos saltator]|uniref:uncharacterized protein LOC112589781 isoform X1 n=1 Tax=Harpegnathos saltator TaxID=610380 RepID=UPI000DBED906|nr:uncharacterized protein LOC112589781 isoform X1 [Harpegnathos saltator]